MADFNGQTAVITGGAQGIGLATAKRFIEDGCEVMIWDMDEKMGLEAAKELNCHFLKMDQTDNKLVEETTEKTINIMKKIDILVCSAGIAGPTFSTWDYPVEEWSKVFNVNVNGVFYCNKHVEENPDCCPAKHVFTISILTDARPDGRTRQAPLEGPTGTPKSSVFLL